MWLRTFTPVGGLLWYKCSPVCESPTQQLMGFDFIVIVPLLLSHWGFSFVSGCGVCFLVNSSVFLSMIVQQLVVILVLTRGSECTSFYSTILNQSCILFYMCCLKKKLNTCNHCANLNIEHCQDLRNVLSNPLLELTTILNFGDNCSFLPLPLFIFYFLRNFFFNFLLLLKYNIHTETCMYHKMTG